MGQSLEAKVKLTLVDKVTKKLNSINKTINSISNRNLQRGSLVSVLPEKIQRTVKEAQRLKAEFKKNNTLISEMGSKLKAVAATYLGIMGGRVLMDTSDMITGTENKLNNINGGNTNATQEQMDKMYAAALRSRSNYGDILSNVSKSMTLSPDAFQDNIDNAIRFQEIMAKSYAIGGASAAEQSSSMYQMIQALGSGVLQGDELRSVTEGAPMAAKAIEKFAQKIYDTDAALKDMGSQGLITSDIVVAAMMDAGENIDKAFEKTDMTISDVFTNIKTVAINAFRPVQDAISGFLNSDKGQQFINGITIAIQYLVGALNILVQAAVNVATFIVNNWSWIQFIVYGIAAAVIYLATVAILQHLWTAILKLASNPFVLWIIGIALVIAYVVHLAQTVSDGCEFIYNLCFALVVGIVALLAVVALVAATTGVMIISTTTMVILLILAAVLLLVMAIAQWGEQIGAVVGAVVAFVYNLVVGVINAIIQYFYSMFVEPIAGLIEWIVNAFSGGFNNIGGAFVNLLGQMLSMLVGFAKPVAKIIDAIFGTKVNDTLSGLQTKMKSWGKNENAQTFKLEAPQLKRMSYDAAINKGASIGAGIQTGINNTFDTVKGGIGNFGSGIQGKLDKSFNVDRNFDKNNPANKINATGYDPEKLGKGVGNIDKNTGKIKDTVDLAEEDLEYLRKLADMEWKKEFTTANITVDMKNNNTINNQGDLDGWLGVLSDKLYEELGMVADGVYS